MKTLGSRRSRSNLSARHIGYPSLTEYMSSSSAACLVLPLETADYFGLADRTVIDIFLKHHTQSQIHFNPADRTVIGT